MVHHEFEETWTINKLHLFCINTRVTTRRGNIRLSPRQYPHTCDTGLVWSQTCSCTDWRRHRSSYLLLGCAARYRATLLYLCTLADLAFGLLNPIFYGIRKTVCASNRVWCRSSRSKTAFFVDFCIKNFFPASTVLCGRNPTIFILSYFTSATIHLCWLRVDPERS